MWTHSWKLKPDCLTSLVIKEASLRRRKAYKRYNRSRKAAKYALLLNKTPELFPVLSLKTRSCIAVCSVSTNKGKTLLGVNHPIQVYKSLIGTNPNLPQILHQACKLIKYIENLLVPLCCLPIDLGLLLRNLNFIRKN